MKLGIVTRNRTLYSTRRLAQAGRERGHDMHIIDPNRCTISLIDGALETRRDGMVIDDFDCVIPRIGVDVDTWCFTLLRQLELQGVPVLNTRQGTRIAANKVRML
ncbi:MAG: 30S ribosomal protein S6--L-glutamate ligase, partial [Persicimonas sp.]